MYILCIYYVYMERERDELDHELDHLRVGFKFHIRWLHFNSFMSCEHLWMEPWSRLRSRLRLGHADGSWELGMAWHGMTSIENQLSQISLELLSYVKISRRWNEIPSIVQKNEFHWKVQ